MISMAELSSMEREFSRDDNLPEDRYLPEELLLEILTRLPSKTLLKFRSVCKTWCSLIDSSNFISLHLKLYNNNSHLIAIERSVGDGCHFTIRCSDTLNKIADLVEFPESYYISGNCNGLILLENDRDEARLWNPCIRKSLVIFSPIARPCRSRYSYVAYALGFSPSSNDHKVVTFTTNRFNDNALIDVYSLTDHLWRRKPNPVSKSNWGLSGLRVPGRIVCCGGVVYWIDRDRRKVGANRKLYLYDFDVEEFSVMQLPDAVKETTTRFIFDHGKSLGVLMMSSESSCIWVLEKDGGWRLWFKGEPNLDASKLVDCSSIVYGQKSNTFLLFNTHDHITMSYNIASNQTRTMMSSRIFFQTYVESLVLHKGFDENITSFL